MKTEKYVARVGFAACATALCAAVACGSKSSTSFGSGEPVSTDDSGAATASSSGTTMGASTSSGGVFTQADAGQGGMGTGTCQTGTYAGSFSCGFIYDPDASMAPTGGSDSGSGFMITGNLSFVLAQSMSGELGQDTASGTFVLNAGITTGMATLSGTLDCGSGQFTGQLSDGMYSLFFGIFSGPFNGPLTSDYNGTSFSFVNGNWALVIPGEGTCPGSWTANFMGDQ